MKKIIITCSIVFSAFSFAQESSEENPFVYDESGQTFADEDEFPGNPGDPGAAPIDEYIPGLILTALGLTIIFARRRKSVH